MIDMGLLFGFDLTQNRCLVVGALIYHLVYLHTRTDALLGPTIFLSHFTAIRHISGLFGEVELGASFLSKELTTDPG